MMPPSRASKGAVARLVALTPVCALLWLSGCDGGQLADDADATAESTQTSGADIDVVGTSEQITAIADVVEAEDGTIWILNTADPFFLAMAPDGSILRSWGREGGGPNEFRSPRTLVLDTAGHRVWAFDGGHHALMRVDGAEDDIETLLLPRDSIPNGRVASTETLGGGRPWIQATGSGFLLALERRDGTLPDLWNIDLVMLGRDGSFGPAFPFSDRFGDPAARYGNTAAEFLPYPLWARCPDGAVALYDPLANGILRLSRDDAVLDTVALPPERELELTFDRVFRMAYGFIRQQAPGGQAPDSAMMRAMLAAEWDEARAAAAGVFPEYADLQCTAPGTIWIQPFDPDAGQMGRGPGWLRITPDGSTASFRFPDSFRPMRFDSARALGIWRGEFDVESVAWMTLPGQ